MYQRFTDRARKVMQFANQEAVRFNHEYVGTEHILLGLVKEESGVASNVLRNLDVDLARLRTEVRKIVEPGAVNVTGSLPQTPRSKKVVEYAIEEARSLNHNYVGTEHLLLGLLREQEGVAAQVLVNVGLNLDAVRGEVLNLLGYNFTGREGDADARSATKTRFKTPTLDSHGQDLTELARRGGLDPLIGRRGQLQMLADVLGCRHRNSPVLVGEPGVGKTTIVMGLAQAIVARSVPEWLDDCRIVELSFSRLWTGVRSEAAFDESLKAILSEIRHTRNGVLFLPDGLRFLAAPRVIPALHALYADWLDVMHPGELRCIFAGTAADYQSCLTRNVQLLERCCQVVPVAPATVDETLAVLRGLRDRFERHHNVQFTDEALTAVANLAEAQLPGALPGKAMVLLDRAGARGRRLAADGSRDVHDALTRLTEQIERLKQAKESAVAEQAFDRAAELKVECERLMREREPLVIEEQRRRRELGGTITATGVAETLRELTGNAPPDDPSHVTAIMRKNE